MYVVLTPNTFGPIANYSVSEKVIGVQVPHAVPTCAATVAVVAVAVIVYPVVEFVQGLRGSVPPMSVA